MSRSVTLYVCLVAITIVSTSCQTVNTPSGPIKGVVVPVNGRDVIQFRNIPYAKPPVGELRFEKPVPIESWTETLDGTAFGPSCMTTQALFGFDELDTHPMSEDCLQLNIFVSGSVNTSAKKSVMVWIHGGAFTLGNSWTYDSSFFALKDVIAVNINYRVGIPGFLSTGDPALPGNYGLWDMVEALRWINTNIAAFGGDPDSVTIFGESAGGFAASYLAIMPVTAGLFQRFISQSGSAIGFMAVAPNPVRAAKATGEFLGCDTNDNKALVACLKQKSAADLMKAQADPSTQYFGTFSLSPLLWPTIDGELLPRAPIDSLNDLNSRESVYFRSLDMIAGTVNNEASMVPMFLGGFQEPMGFNMSDGIPTTVLCNIFAPTLAREMFHDDTIASEMMCKEYASDDMAQQARNLGDLHQDTWFISPTVQMLDFHAKGKLSPNTYQYLYTQTIDFFYLVPSFPWTAGAGHASELLYMFGPTNLNAMDPSLSTEEARAFSDTLVTYWTNFAKTGNPNGEGLVPWKAFSPDGRHYLELKYVPIMRQNLFNRRMKFLLEEVPHKIRQHATKTEL